MNVREEPDMRNVLLLGLALMGTAMVPLGAEVFRFRYRPEEKYRLVTEVTEDVYVNGSLNHRASILNKIAVETLNVKDGRGLLSTTFLTSERGYGVQTSYVLDPLDQEYLSVFWRDGLGNYEIGPEYFMPVVRNVPVFPEEDIQPGHSWMAPGEEVHDFRRSFGVSQPVRFPIRVQYTYRGTEQRNGKELDVFSIEYDVFYRPQGLRSSRGLVPVRISGRSEQTYYWDGAQGQPDSYNESFDFIFQLSSGDYVEYVGTARGEMLVSAPLEREEVAEAIRKDLRELGVEDATVTPGEEGVTVNLQNIQFPPNSAVLVDSEMAKLDKIGEMLKKYDRRDILVSGHTARVPGYSDADHQELSEARARAVADYLILIGALRQTQVTSRGMGQRDPLADNSTEQGRRLNRRVEITILEN
jgi:outer membrane protein OmpA-like peptidoglycan-associated protein